MSVDVFGSRDDPSALVPGKRLALVYVTFTHQDGSAFERFCPVEWNAGEEEEDVARRACLMTHANLRAMLQLASEGAGTPGSLRV